MAACDFGYGIDVLDAEAKLRSDAAYKLIRYAPSDVFEDYLDTLSDEGREDNTESAQEFVEKWEDPTYLDSGIWALLTAILRDVIGVEHIALNDNYLYYSAHIPANEEERAAMLTKEQIQVLFAEHVNPLLKDGEFVTLENVEIIDFGA